MGLKYASTWSVCFWSANRLSKNRPPRRPNFWGSVQKIYFSKNSFDSQMGRASSIFISALQLLTLRPLRRRCTRTQPRLKNLVRFNFNPWSSGHFSNCSNIKFWGIIVFSERGRRLVCASCSADIGFDAGLFFMPKRRGYCFDLCGKAGEDIGLYFLEVSRGVWLPFIEKINLFL